MEAYLNVAKAYVEVGSMPGGMATQIARIRALESALGHQWTTLSSKLTGRSRWSSTGHIDPKERVSL